MLSKKTHTSWNKGLTKETDERMRLISEKVSETKKRLYKEGKYPFCFKKGHKPLSSCFKKGHIYFVSKGFQGKHHTKESRIKTSESLRGEKCYMWQGGKSFEPYGLEFNNELKEQIRQRDQYRCQQCFRHQSELFRNTKSGMKPCKLYIHHIDYNKKNNKPENLLSLCMSCHAQTGFDRDDWTKYFQDKINVGVVI